MHIFVGNLSFESNEGDVKKLFEGFGNVASVAIVMRKEKKAPKSRGFGFVDMPDEQQALAAIAGINGKEFMGRVHDVEPARPKVEAKAESKPNKKREPKVVVEAEQRPLSYPVFNKDHAFPDHNVRNKSGSRQRLLDGRERAPRPNGRVGTPPSAVDRRVRPFGQHLALNDGQVYPSGQPGSYKGGRRSVSYMKRHGLAGAGQETNPRRRNQENPMRWRKRADQPKPWQKSSGEHKPWKKTEGEARPWKKAEGEFKPWRKSEGGIKPWKKPAGDAKSWKKPVGDAKPWSKSSERPQKSRFNGRRKPGGYKR